MSLATVTDPRSIAFVDIRDDVIRGYIAIWGDPENRDAYGTWFDRENPPEMGLELKPFPLLYEHGQDAEIGKAIIGRVNDVGLDRVGIWFEATLDSTGKFYRRVRDEIIAAELETSSASAEHIAEFDADGRFVTWILSELSLTKTPAEERMPVVQLLREGKRHFYRAVSDTTTGDSSETAQCETDNRQTDNHKSSQRGENMSQKLTDLGLQRGQGNALLRALVSRYGHERIQTAVQSRKAGDNVTLNVLFGETRGLQEIGVDPNIDPNVLLNAMIEEYGYDDLLNALQAMQQETPEGMSQPQQQPTALSLPPSGNYTVPPDQARNQQLVNQAPPADVNALIEAAVRQALQQQAASDTTPAQPADVQTRDDRRENRTPVIQADDMRYAHLKTEDMVFGYEVMKSTGRNVPQTYVRAMYYKAARAVENNHTTMTNLAVRSIFVTPDNRHVRADEVMQSDLSGYGDEWVGVAYGTDLWEKARATRIYDMMQSHGLWEQEIGQGMESIYIPTESSDPTWYTSTQSENIDVSGRPEVTSKTSRVGTGRRLVTPGEATAAIVWNDTFEEDSLIPALPQLRRQMEESTQDTIEYVLLNGDTETSASTNINLIDGTPATGLEKPIYLVTDGILKLALVTNSSQSRSGGTLDENDYIETLKLLPLALRQKRDRCMYIIDGNTEIKSLQLPVVKTRDVNTAATIEGGELTRIWGVDIFSSGQLALANSAGKISATASNNTLGRIVIAYMPYWSLVWKRRVRTEVGRDILAKANMIVTSLRLGFTYRSTDAAAVTYNLTV